MPKALIAIFIAVFLLAFGMSFVSPLVPLLLQNIGASSATIGQIQTVYFLSFTITTSLFGRLIDRVGSKKLIILGLAIFGLAIFLMPLMPTPAFFYLIRVIQGIGSAFLFAPTEAAINIISPPEKRASNMGTYGLVFAAGFAVGPVIGTSLYAMQPSLPFTFAALSCCAAIVVLLCGFKDTPVPVKKTLWGFSDMLGALKIPLMAAACYAVVEISMAAFLSLYLNSLSITGASLGIVFTFFAVGGMLSPFPAGWLADKWGKLPVLRLCGFMLIAATCGFTLTENYWAICLLTTAIGIIAGALYPVALALIGECVPPQKMGVANASFSFFYGLGSIAGPLVTGWVIQLSSIKSLFYPLAVSALLFTIITSIKTPQKSGIE